MLTVYAGSGRPHDIVSGGRIGRGGDASAHADALALLVVARNHAAFLHRGRGSQGSVIHVAGSTHDEAGVEGSGVQRSFERLAADVVPIAIVSSMSFLVAVVKTK